MSNVKYRLSLTQVERLDLEDIVSKGKSTVATAYRSAFANSIQYNMLYGQHKVIS